MPTHLFHIELITPSADKLRFIVEAYDAEGARRIAEDEAKRRGDLDDDDLANPDPEVYLSEPELIEVVTGTPGLRLVTD